MLVSACCMALCYLFLAALPAAAQPPPACVPEAGQAAPPPNCHVVRVGPPSIQFPNGDTFFQDLDSGSRSDNPPGTVNPAITVIPVGHTIQWQFFYSHSSQSGTCASPGSINCTPSNPLLWNSGIRTGNANGNDTFTRTFNQPGVFTYFCGVHFGLMRGIVVVLMNNQDYDLFANPDPTIGPPPPMPTQTIFAGGSTSFAGILNSYKNFTSSLDLTCASGNPRVPGNCPMTSTTVDPVSNQFFATTPFTFAVSEAVGGDYFFDIVANPQPPAQTPFTHRKTVLLRVNDLSLTVPASTVSTLRGQNVQTSGQVRSLGVFAGNVTMSCTVSPPGPNCAVTPSTFSLAAGATQNLTFNLTNTLLNANNFTVNVVAASNATSPGPGAFTRPKSFPLAVRAAEAITVSPTVTNPNAGQVVSVVVRAVDASGNQVANYNGTVQVTSSDAAAVLPSPFTFNPAVDNGLRIVNVTLNSGGSHTITVRDTTPFATTGTSPLLQVRGATQMKVQPATLTPTAGQPFNLMVTVFDNNDAVADIYRGTAEFSTTDPSPLAVVPGDHLFNMVDAGVHTFAGVILNTIGPQTISVNDATQPGISGTSPLIIVQPASAADNTVTVSSSRAPNIDAYFQHDNVTFTATVTDNGVGATPTGKVHFYDGATKISPAAGVTLAQLSPGVARATFTLGLRRLVTGGHAITVVYDGDGSFTPNISVPFSQPRSPAPRCIQNVCPGSR